MRRIAYYLTHYPPMSSGIADYATRFKYVLEVSTYWRLETVACP